MFLNSSKCVRSSAFGCDQRQLLVRGRQCNLWIAEQHYAISLVIYLFIPSVLQASEGNLCDSVGYEPLRLIHAVYDHSDTHQLRK